MTLVTVPATTANLGPGFDCIGAALSLYNQFQFTSLDDSSANSLIIKVTGTEAQQVTTDTSNLAYQSFQKFYQHLGKNTPPVAITIKLGIPLARGLGSSATAILGGLMGANQLAGKPLNPQEIMQLAIEIEGHPDNVVPALLGNCQLSVSQDHNWEICPIPWHSEIIPVVAIPDFELSTQQARSVLPPQISYHDAIFNLSHMGLLVRGLASNNPQWLKVALQDKLHQPYRQSLIRGYAHIQEAALAAGAYGMVISGAGPTLLAPTPSQKIEAVVAAMKNAWQKLGVTAQVLPLALDAQGTRIEA